MADLVDSCSFASRDANTAIRTYSYGGGGQSFACSATKILDSIKIYLDAGTAANGTVSIDVYSHTGTYGSTGVCDALLATSDTKNVTDISSGNQYDFPFSGANRITLTNGTKYCLIAKLTGTSGSDYLYEGLVSSDVASGNQIEGSPPSSWSYNPTRDVCFEVYGVAAAGAGGGLSNHYYFS